MAKIKSIEIYRVAMPLIYPFRTALGNEEMIESVLVRITSAGFYGWGESAPWQRPAYSPESAAGVFMTIRDFLARLILGKDIGSGNGLQKALLPVKGNFFAKAALDLAWWDLHAKIVGKPLWKILGGKDEVIEVGADLGVMESIDLLLEEINKAVENGFKRIKLKYRPGWDLEMIAAVRKAFPKTVFHIDCNSAYTLDDIPMFKKLDRYNLAMIEQPLMHDDIIDHAELQKHIKTDICLDESITSVDKARKAIKINACRWVNIKPGRVGGITNSIAIHNICQSAGIGCWVGGMLESSVGASFCGALATLPNIKYPSDIFPTSRFYKQDLGVPEMALTGPSEMTVSSNAGVGAEPDAGCLKKMTIENLFLKYKSADSYHLNL